MSFIWTWKLGSYRTTVFSLQQPSDGPITWICFTQHELDTRWKQTAIEVVAGNQFYLNMKNLQLSDYSLGSSTTVRWDTYLDLFFAAQTWHQMEAKCYRGSCRQLVLSVHENLKAIGLEFSALDVSQSRYFPGYVFRTTIWRPDESILL